MTDEQIIKALKCCIDCKCKECPCYKSIDGEMRCTEIDEEEILDLINRQQAENERLNSNCEKLQIKYDNALNDSKHYKRLYEISKSEAKKEFEEKSEKILIEKYEKYHRIANNTQLKEGVDMFYQGRAEAIWECIDINRNLVKEMTE